MVQDAYFSLANNFQSFFVGAIQSFWWLLLFVITFPIFINLWLWWRQTIQEASIVWMLLEIKPPREVRKSPKAMEQVFTGLYALRNSPGNFWEKWIEGDTTKWFSFEIISVGGEIHFYIYTPLKYKNIIEANFYAHYPDMEIMTVPDYTDKLPSNTTEIYKNGFDIFGSELKLKIDDAYPIRTYVQFETPEEEERLDPISTFIESLGKLKKHESFWLQFIIRPADPEWKGKGEKLVKELKEKSTKTVKTETGTISMPVALTPGELDVIKAIEHNISKAGFDTIIRFLYFAPREIYDDTFPNKGIPTIFNQYSAMNLNSFQHNSDVRTLPTQWYRFPYLNIQQRLEGRKQRILKNYKIRSFPEELAIGKFLNLNPTNFNFFSTYFVLNTEELATLYHLPSHFILTSPYIPEIESKKAGPPAGLPIFKEE